MAEIKRFRLLIIGKTGCGKTTILSKLCGDDVADMPTAHERGKHDIERELDFRTNDKLVAHDSEGFEAGEEAQYRVVTEFIRRRGTMQDVNQRLHMVWYCVEMNTRPVQMAEEQFFGAKRDVPVIAIFTKFDNYVEDMVQQIQEEAEDDDPPKPLSEVDKLAEEKAQESFKDNYRSRLEKLPFPPEAIVALSRTHESTPEDSRLSELVRQTMAALIPSDDSRMTPERRQEQERLRELFVTAQTADLTVKVENAIATSMRIGYESLGKRPIERQRLIDLWNTKWSSQDSKSFSWLNRQLQQHVDFSPRLIGHENSPDFNQVEQWNEQLRQCAALEEMVSDSVIIMRYIFLLSTKDQAQVQRLIEWYDGNSSVAKQLREALVSKHSQNPKNNVGLKPLDLITIVSGLTFEAPDIKVSAEVKSGTRLPAASAEPQKGLFSKIFKKKDKHNK
ncbi:GTPase domain-containing protein [Phanerochaete sordida]|uniref:GTPase domain-containing protein n=1 Tax=Phanerochaete sordida TaxID=48140 RepID=A0A9P3LJM7_9APHY|nr:GTPase domain-containing protein [Phanerochaete sordida]